MYNIYIKVRYMISYIDSYHTGGYMPHIMLLSPVEAVVGSSSSGRIGCMAQRDNNAQHNYTVAQ